MIIAENIVVGLGSTEKQVLDKGSQNNQPLVYI